MYPPVAPPRRTPGTVLALRILVALQLAGLVLVAVLALVLTGFAGTGLNSDDDLTRGFAGLGVVLGIVALAGVVVAGVALGVPLFLIRGGRPRGCMPALIVLVVAESFAALLGVLGLLSGLADGRPGDALGPFLFTIVPAAVILLAMVPVTRAWAAATAIGWVGPPGPYPPNGPYPPAGQFPPPGPYPPAEPTSWYPNP